MYLFFKGSLFLHSVLCALNTLQWRTRSCPGSQSNTFLSSEMPTKGYYRDPCKYCPASILLWGGWSHCWFYCSSFEALGLAIVWTGWKLRCCNLRGQYAWNPWKVKSSVCVVLPASGCGRFSMLSCLSVKACDIISSLYQDCWFCFFLLTFLLLYMAAAPNAACICFIQPLLSCSSKLPLVLSRAKSKAHPGHRAILLHGPSLK